MVPLAAPIETFIQIAAGARDTVITKQVAVDRGLLEQVSAVASTIITLALLVLTVVAVPVAWHFRKTYKKVNHLLDRIYGDITPIMHHAAAISDNVNFITTSIRTDVQKVNATIATANERVQHAVAQAEDRLNEFNALLSVVQEEAEQLFVHSASTLRAIRTGAEAFRDDVGMDLASDGLDTADEADDIEHQLQMESQEESDGYDGSSQSPAAASPTAPRLRPRTRNQRSRPGE